ncbi:MAG: ribosome small subunit-dependent GTPase A [Bacteroidaceae bacterium]|nr:ribosome small subunit-dependent GTPase A [Bacteroidaceae bacterium]
MRGLVIKSTGSSYLVRTDDGAVQECRIKGSFRIKGIKSTNPVAVGDYVGFQQAQEGIPAYITSIEERRNYIVRRSSNLSKQSHILACNLDLCLLVVTVSHPETSPVFIDRFLASAQAYRIPVNIVINKQDLLDGPGMSVAKEWMELYRNIGYDCILCDSLHGSIDAISALLKDKVTLISGNSGVGKSTLVNRLVPDLKQRTAAVSEKHDTGMHTTTFSEMFQLADGGWIIDSPGVKGFGTFDMGVHEVSHYFPEIFSAQSKCRYQDCTHTCEPGCAVLEAVEQGSISVSRYNSYLSILEDMDEGKYRKL